MSLNGAVVVVSFDGVDHMRDFHMPWRRLHGKFPDHGTHASCVDDACCVHVAGCLLCSKSRVVRVHNVFHRRIERDASRKRQVAA